MVFLDFVERYNLEDNTTLSFKFNLNEYSQDEIKGFAENIFFYVQQNSHGDHIFFSGGIHYKGEAELPHCHLHFCVQHWRADKNESRRRGAVGGMPDKLSCKISSLNDAEHLEKQMSYPYKENNILRFEHVGIRKRIVSFPENVELYLVKNAIALYEQSLAIKRKKARANERSGNLQQQLVELCAERTFSNYTEYKEYIYRVFYNGLELHEYPDPRSLVKEVGNVAIFKKIVPPYYFDKN